jgi:riboflavin kinase / FMN adenylyltransferase
VVSASGSLICIGIFDGVHLGHQSLIASAKDYARQLNLTLIVCTFDPHPNTVVRPDHAPKLISDINHRKQLLVDCGVEHVEVITFNSQIANLTPIEFSREFLSDRLGARVVVVGQNFIYGRNGSGDVDTLRENGYECGFEVRVIDLLDSDGTVSSTRIRECVRLGQVESAAALLGRNFVLSGNVIRGDQRGRELGYPTANLEWEDQLIVPADGVYAGYLIANGDRMPAAISIGLNPHFEGKSQRVEAYALDRLDLELYGVSVDIEFVAMIREQEVFDSLDGYLTQIAKDVVAIADLLSR